MAASLYEPLEEADRRELERALAADSGLRREAEELDRVRQMVRLDAPEFSGDLVPVVRARMLELQPIRRARMGWAWVSGAAVTVGVASVVFVAVVGSPGISSGRGSVQGSVAAKSSVTDAQKALDRARQLMASHDGAGAKAILEQVVASGASKEDAGTAQQLLANLEFKEFRRYPEAYAAYDRLRTAYPDSFMNSPECIERFNLLDEARRAGYAPMYALDAIRNHPTNAFEQCERLMAQYPDSLVATVAMNEMREMVGLPGQLDGASHVIALERVRNRCSDPAAVAQVTLALGNACRDDLCDAGRARVFYNEVVSSGQDTVAVRAQEALARLAADTP